MSQPKRELAVGGRGFIPANHVWVHRPGDSVHISRRFFGEQADAGNGAVLVERVSADQYRLTLHPGFRVERYSESEAHTGQLQPIHLIVDEKGATHTTMPSKYLIL